MGMTGIIWLVTMRGRPFVGLMYYQLYVGLHLMHVFAQYQWLRIPFITALLTFFSLLSTKDSKKIYFAPQTKLMVALFITMCLSRLVNGVEVMGHKYMDSFYKIIFAHILVINLVNSKDRLRNFIWVLIISGAALAYVAHYYDSETAYYWQAKNGFARELLFMATFPVFIAISQKKLILKIESMGYFVLILYAIIGTNSRGAYLGLAVILFLIILSDFNVKRLLVTLIIIMIVLSRISDIYWESFSTINSDIEQGGTGGQRLAAWATAKRMVEANPFLGVGTGEYANNFVIYSNYEDQLRVGGRTGEETTNVHNAPLQVLSENGFIGFCIFLLIMILSYKDLINALKMCRGDPALADLKQITKALGIALTGYLVAAQFSNDGYTLQLYILISLIVASRKIAEKTINTNMNEMDKQDSQYIIPYQGELAIRILTFAVFSYICLRL